MKASSFLSIPLPPSHLCHWSTDRPDASLCCLKPFSRPAGASDNNPLHFLVCNCKICDLGQHTQWGRQVGWLPTKTHAPIPQHAVAGPPLFSQGYASQFPLLLDGTNGIGTKVTRTSPLGRGVSEAGGPLLYCLFSYLLAARKTKTQRDGGHLPLTERKVLRSLNASVEQSPSATNQEFTFGLPSREKCLSQ